MAHAANHATGGDRRLEERLRLILPGRFKTASRYEAMCVTEDVSPSGMGLLSSVRVNVYDDIELRIRDLGVIHGQVARVTPTGFGVRITRSSMERVELARAMIALASAQRATNTPAIRKAERIVPVRQDAVMHLHGGRLVNVRIDNYSATGAAILVPDGEAPHVGNTVVLGRKAAKVVRHMEGGIGVAFVRPYDPETFNASVRL